MAELRMVVTCNHLPSDYVLDPDQFAVADDFGSAWAQMFTERLAAHPELGPVVQWGNSTTRVEHQNTDVSGSTSGQVVVTSVVTGFPNAYITGWADSPLKALVDDVFAQAQAGDVAATIGALIGLAGDPSHLKLASFWRFDDRT